MGVPRGEGSAAARGLIPAARDRPAACWPPPQGPHKAVRKEPKHYRSGAPRRDFTNSYLVLVVVSETNDEDCEAKTLRAERLWGQGREGEGVENEPRSAPPRKDGAFGHVRHERRHAAADAAVEREEGSGRGRMSNGQISTQPKKWPNQGPVGT